MTKLFDHFEVDGAYVGLTRAEVSRLRQLHNGHRPYLDRYYEALRTFCNGLAEGQTLVRSLAVVADINRIPQNLYDGMKWWAWVAASRRFPHMDHWVQNRQQRVVAFDAMHEQDSDGLVVADAVAYWFGAQLLPESAALAQGIDVPYCASILDRMDPNWMPSISTAR